MRGASPPPGHCSGVLEQGTGALSAWGALICRSHIADVYQQQFMSMGSVYACVCFRVCVCINSDGVKNWTSPRGEIKQLFFKLRVMNVTTWRNRDRKFSRFKGHTSWKQSNMLVLFQAPLNHLHGSLCLELHCNMETRFLQLIQFPLRENIWGHNDKAGQLYCA